MISVLIILVLHNTAVDKQCNSEIQNEIDSLNVEIKAMEYQWEAGITSVAVLTPERRFMRLGNHKPFIDPAEVALYEYESRTIPNIIDWKNVNNKNWLTPVKDQGDCGSCYVFAPVAVIESIYKIEEDQAASNPDLSEQHVLDCEVVGNCREGGFVDDVLRFIKNTGISRESCYPYVARDRRCQPCDNWKRNGIKIHGWSAISTNTENRQALFNALQDGPVVGDMEVYSDFYYYRKGVYKKVPSAYYEGAHAIAIVGYNKTDRYWICKNSWGPDWGENGYFRVAFGQVGLGLWTYKVWGVITGNVPPVFESLSNQTVEEAEMLSFKVKARDANNDPVNYSSSNLPAGAAFDSVSGQFTWTPDYNQSGLYQVSFIASDGILSAKKSIHITVINVKKGKKRF